VGRVERVRGLLQPLERLGRILRALPHAFFE
jgi:hypothetical protein